MQTTQQPLLELLGRKGAQFVIPVYQRVYTWSEQQCNELWNDVSRAARLGSQHFLGTVLYVPEEEGEFDSVQLDIIDGQQRMGTVTILIAALVRHLREQAAAGTGTGAGAPNIDAEAIAQRYLHVAGGADVAGASAADGAGASSADASTSACKLVLSRPDHNTLIAVLGDGEMPEEPSERVVSNFELFLGKMQTEDFDPAALWAGIEQLLIIAAELTVDDSPQLVFESLNSKGMPLTTGDLVRNSLLVSVSHEEQSRLYTEYWEPIEAAFGDDPGSTKLNAAVHAWLAVRFPKMHVSSRNEVYSVFKSYVSDEYDGPLEDLLDELRGFCIMYSKNYEFRGDRSFMAADWAKGKSRTRVDSIAAAYAARGFNVPASQLKGL